MRRENIGLKLIWRPETQIEINVAIWAIANILAITASDTIICHGCVSVSIVG